MITVQPWLVIQLHAPIQLSYQEPWEQRCALNSSQASAITTTAAAVAPARHTISDNLTAVCVWGAVVEQESTKSWSIPQHQGSPPVTKGINRSFPLTRLTHPSSSRRHIWPHRTAAHHHVQSDQANRAVRSPRICCLPPPCTRHQSITVQTPTHMPIFIYLASQHCSPQRCAHETGGQDYMAEGTLQPEWVTLVIPELRVAAAGFTCQRLGGETLTGSMTMQVWHAMNGGMEVWRDQQEDCRSRRCTEAAGGAGHMLEHWPPWLLGRPSCPKYRLWLFPWPILFIQRPTMTTVHAGSVTQGSQKSNWVTTATKMCG